MTFLNSTQGPWIQKWVITTTFCRRVLEVGFGLPTVRDGAGLTADSWGGHKRHLRWNHGWCSWPIPSARHFSIRLLLNWATKHSSHESHEYLWPASTGRQVWLCMFGKALASFSYEPRVFRFPALAKDQGRGEGKCNAPSHTPEPPGEAQFDSNVLYFVLNSGCSSKHSRFCIGHHFDLSFLRKTT